MDLIVREKRIGVGGETMIKWLVSCKHYANGNKSVSANDELNILERVISHKCNGFIGFYSTIAATSLSSVLDGLETKIESKIYDGVRIEKDILSKANHRDRILATYFPKSHDKYRQTIFSEPGLHEVGNISAITEEIVFNICKTAIITLEVDKLKEQYQSDRDWEKRNKILGQLYKFSNHSTENLANYIFSFLMDVSHETRHDFPEYIAANLEGLVHTFYPSSYDDEKQRQKLIENGKMCVYIGFNIAYDSFIKTGNFRIAEYGLSIFKTVYRYSKQYQLNDVLSLLDEQYQSLEDTLKRPERTDLGYAQEFTAIYRKDIASWGHYIPDLPEHLTKLIEH